MTRSANGLVIAAPGSGSGKTTVTLALLRALRARGTDVASAKTGPDYIDPAFHAAASGRSCVNLDAFAMAPGRIRHLFAEQAADADLVIVEGAMGLFDGAATGTGSTADVAAILRLPVVLVVDTAKQSQSIAALVRGFRDHRPDVAVVGVILNRVGSHRHQTMLENALAAIDMPVLGALPRDPLLSLPDRHLGLVQAGEHRDLERFLDTAADHLAQACDIDRLLTAARPSEGTGPRTRPLAPLGQRIAVARDTAFAFTYPHLLEAWRDQGAEILPFSPLEDTPPDATCDAVYLPGGYPELHSARIAHAAAFRQGMHAATRRGARIYGECGGYMVLGDGLTDAEGIRHTMLGLLPLETSFRERKRHLGYRQLLAHPGSPWPGHLTGHEFHYATTRSEGAADRLFEARDAADTLIGDVGLRVGTVMGSFMHVIDRATSQSG